MKRALLTTDETIEQNLKKKFKKSLRSVSRAPRVTANFKIFFQVKSTEILGLLSYRPWELVVTREVRLGDRKLVFFFSKIYALKNTAN